MKKLLDFFMYFMWAVSLTAMSESHLAKTPRLKAFFDGFEFHIVRIINWQAHADTREEMLTLTRYFERCTVALLFGLVAFSLLHVPAAARLLLAPIAISASAWMSFFWTFKHRDALRPLFPWAFFLLGFPIALFALDTFADTTVLLDMYNKFPVKPVLLETNLGAAVAITGALLIALMLYYVLGWFVLSPFAYVVLGFLKFCRLASLALVRHVNRDVWNYLVFFIALATGFYSFFFVG